MADITAKDLKDFFKSKDIKVNVPTPRANVVAALLFLIPAAVGGLWAWLAQSIWPAIPWAIAGWILSKAPKIAKQWERAIVLRLGKYIGQRGPGLFWIVPFVDSVAAWIDQRTITTNLAAEETLTSDTYR
jgi:SPFH domain / Band 7 family